MNPGSEELYTREITRSHRGAFVIAIDQSASMQESTVLANEVMTKAEAVAVVTGRLVDELVMRARRDDGVRDYYDLAIVGYSCGEVYSLLGAEPAFVPVNVVASHIPERFSIRVERLLPSGGREEASERLTAWVRPHAEGDTPMYEMLLTVRDMVERWCADPRNSDSFPPVVFNITDGESTDCDEEQLRHAAGRLRDLSTSDGNTLLFNIHIATGESGESMLFPRADEIGAEDHYARLLADISSPVPDSLNDCIRSFRGDFAPPPFIAMSYNASITEAVAMLNIGSRSLTSIR